MTLKVIASIISGMSQMPRYRAANKLATETSFLAAMSPDCRVKHLFDAHTEAPMEFRAARIINSIILEAAPISAERLKRRFAGGGVVMALLACRYNHVARRSGPSVENRP